MSCECDKLRQLYERFSSDHLEAITLAKNHIASMTEGPDVTEKQMFNPEYQGEAQAPISNPYGSHSSTPTTYFVQGIITAYDLAPVTSSYPMNHTQALPQENYKSVTPLPVEGNADMLEDMISKARMEESEWMSTNR